MDRREKIRVVGYRVDSLILIISVCKGGNYVNEVENWYFFGIILFLKNEHCIWKYPRPILKKLETML